MCLSTLATTSIRRSREGVPDVTRWFQLYVYDDRGISRELVAQAVAHGCEALVVTVDLPVRGVRERELRVEAESVATASAMTRSGRAAGRPDDTRRCLGAGRSRR